MKNGSTKLGFDYALRVLESCYTAYDGGYVSSLEGSALRVSPRRFRTTPRSLTDATRVEQHQPIGRSNLTWPCLAGSSWVDDVASPNKNHAVRILEVELGWLFDRDPYIGLIIYLFIFYSLFMTG